MATPQQILEARKALMGGFWNRPEDEQVDIWGNLGGQKSQPVVPQVNQQINQQAPGPKGFDMAALIQALNAPRGRHLGIGGAEMSASNPMGNFGGDPFTNGFFKPNVPLEGNGLQRAVNYNNQMGGSPFAQQAAVTHPQPGQNPFPLTAGANGIPYGSFEEGGMIDPKLPDNQRFKDNNFWSASGSVNYPAFGQVPDPKKKKSFEFGTKRPQFTGF